MVGTEPSAVPVPSAGLQLPPQRQVIAAARQSGGTVVYIVDSHRPGLRRDREFAKRTPHCIEGTWGAQVIDELAPTPDDIVVLKRRYSGFFNTDLDLTLKYMAIDAVVAMGVVTNFIGGWIGARYGLKTTLFAGLTIQIAALVMLSAVRRRADGRRTVTLVPTPASLSISRRPPWSSTSALVNGRPRPVPEWVRSRLPLTCAKGASAIGISSSDMTWSVTRSSSRMSRRPRLSPASIWHAQ